VNTDRDRTLMELTRRNPFWVCLLVFALLAADDGFRLANALEQRRQLGQAQLVQAQNVGRMTETLANPPQIEAKLQALSLDLIQVASTNLMARQIVREFNIQWNPGSESLLASAPLPTALAAPASNLTPKNANAQNIHGTVPAAAAPATNPAAWT